MLADKTMWAVIVEDYDYTHSCIDWKVYPFSEGYQAMRRMGEEVSKHVMNRVAVVRLLEDGSYSVYSAVCSMRAGDLTGLCTSSGELHALENEVASALGLIQEPEVAS